MAFRLHCLFIMISYSYYNTKEEISRLIFSLGFHDKNENALKVTLLKIKADILSFQNRYCLLTHFIKQVLGTTSAENVSRNCLK